MVDSRQVLGILQDARELVRSDWGSSGRASFEEAHGASCASIGICATCEHPSTKLAAHVAFLRGAGVPVPNGEDEVYEAVYQFNDAQLSRAPVVAAFDSAIRIVEAQIAGPSETPNADAALEIMRGCDQMGALIARVVLREHPTMDRQEIASLVSTELFYAAQDAANALGVTVPQS